MALAIVIVDGAVLVALYCRFWLTTALYLSDLQTAKAVKLVIARDCRYLLSAVKVRYLSRR